MKFTSEADEAIRNRTWHGLKVEGVGLASYSKMVSEVVDATRNTFNGMQHRDRSKDPEPIPIDYAEADREDEFE